MSMFGPTGGGSASPLTTKGDIWGFGSADTRLPVGSDYQGIVADQNATNGIRYATNYKGAKNYITYCDFENNSTSGWSLAHSALSSSVPTSTASAGTPFDSTHGGSAAHNTLSLSMAGSPIGGSHSLRLFDSGTSVAGDLMISSAFTIDTEDQAKVLTIKFYYQNNTGTSINFSGTSSNQYAIYIYDVTNGAWIQPAGVYGMTQGSGVGYCTATFQTTSNSTQYQLALVLLQANGAPDLTIDDFFVGPQTSPAGTIITDWVSYTPTFAGLGTPTNVAFKSRRAGDALEILGYVTAGTTTATIGTFTIGYNGASGNVSIDTSKLPNGSSLANLVGVMGYSAAGAPSYYVVAPSNATTTLELSTQSSTVAALSPPTANNLFSSGQSFSLYAKVPIVGWSSNVQMSNDTDTRVVAATAHVSSGSSTASTSPINFDTVDFDTHGAITTGAGAWKYTVPVSGYYQVAASGYFGATTAVLSLYKNGSIFRALGTAIANSNNGIGSTIVQCNAGDTLAVYPSSTATPTTDDGSISASNWIAINRLSGPSVVAATESVNASYYCSTNQSASSSAQINFDTKLYDTHNAVTTGASWVFTAPVSGKYNIGGFWNVSAGISGDWMLYKNGSVFQSISHANTTVSWVNPNTTIQLNAGDAIMIRPSVSATILGGTLSSAGTSYICITRVGN